MIETIKKYDEAVFLFLNGVHTDWLDKIMVLVSGNYLWLPLYAVLIFFIIKQYKKQSWQAILALVAVVTLCDRFTSGFMKPYFQRLRPCHEAHLQSLVHTVQNCGGQFGFASSHAANTWGAAVFIFLLFGSNKKWGAVLFTWASLVSYSRIYLGVHYPGDVITGAGVGALMAWLVYTLLFKFLQKPTHSTVETEKGH